MDVFVQREIPIELSVSRVLNCWQNIFHFIKRVINKGKIWLDWGKCCSFGLAFILISDTKEGDGEVGGGFSPCGVQKDLVYLQAPPLQTAPHNDVLCGVQKRFQHNR